MSKKIKILIIIIVLVLLIPFGYRQYINKTIVSNINNLANKGFMVVKEKDNSGYLSTNLSYKLIISNPNQIYKEFLSKLVNKTQEQFVHKLILLLNGSEITVDINILNFPVLHNNAVNIYYTSLPPKITAKASSNALLHELSTFLYNKGLGESINISALGKFTSIQVKNIDKIFEGKNGNLTLKLKDYVSKIDKFNIEEHHYKFKVKNKLLEFDINSKNGMKMSSNYHKLKCDINKEGLYDSKLICELGKFNLNIKKYKNQTLSLDNILIYTKSKLEANNINYKYKYKIKNINFKTKSIYGRKNSVVIDNFEYSGSIKGISKDALNDIYNMQYKGKRFYLNKQYQKAILKVINNGFDFNIDNLSIDSMSFGSGSRKITLGNISINMNLKILKNNINFTKRVKPLMLLRYLNLKMKISLAKKDYNLLKKLDKRNKIKRITKLAKFDGDNAVFDIDFAKGKLTINNQSIF